LARNHALVDGNKRTAWAAAWTFLYLNDIELDPDFDVDDAEDFMNTVAAQGDLELSELAEKLRTFG
jgi:death-on-curing protein